MAGADRVVWAENSQAPIFSTKALDTFEKLAKRYFERICETFQTSGPDLFVAIFQF